MLWHQHNPGRVLGMNVQVPTYIFKTMLTSTEFNRDKWQPVLWTILLYIARKKIILRAMHVQRYILPQAAML